MKTSTHRVRNLLAMGQVAISFMLLIGAGLMIRSFIKLQLVDPGYRGENVLAGNVPFNFSKYKTNQDVINFFDLVTQKLKGTPGILGVAVNSGAPLAQGMPMNQAFSIENRPVDPQAAQPVTDIEFATPNAFQILGIPLLSGRFFTDHDNDKAPPAIIISQSFAQHYFPHEDPINKRVSGDNGKTWATIVGVVGDVKQFGLDHDAVDTTYVPLAQQANGGTLLVKTAGDPWKYVSQIRKAVYSVDPDQPITDIATLDQLRGESLALTRLTSVLLALFAALALAIAATGLSGVTALLVSQRTREIGIRLALGAQRSEVLRMVVAQSMRVIMIGLAAGVVGALLGSRLMSSLLFKTPSTDPVTFFAVALLLLLVALIASYVPARRVTRVDPLIALRTE